MSLISWIPATLRPLLRSLPLVAACALGAGSAGMAAGCTSQQRPSLRFLAVENASAAKPVLLVQVTNPERRPIRLQRLEYTFAAASAGEHDEHRSRGEVLLSRDVAAGAAVIVEVPVQLEDLGGSKGPFTLEGNLTASIDRIERIYPITVDVPLDAPK